MNGYRYEVKILNGLIMAGSGNEFGQPRDMILRRKVEER